ncbi:MAG: T9SS type A sorting domain-containing protein [candidate division KSB1 bacterium]|nr:T9SS type A sorting domain-containing protein [candidate division KSB1 bacterium]
MSYQSLYKVLLVTLIILFSRAPAQPEHDRVDGNLIQFNDNGAWCWYQDERAVIDIAHDKLILGSNASGDGVGGSSRDGHIEGVIHDLSTGLSERSLFMDAYCDDHNAPAFLVLPDGSYLAMYSQHYDEYSRYRIYDGTDWSSENRFDWRDIPGGTDFSTTYANLFYLSAENKVYNIVRSYARSPNMMVSTDTAATWSYGGLVTEPDESIGYVNGYFKYSSNGVDRIDFIATEHHPRDYNTSIYHGYIQGGQTFKSDGTLMDEDISDKSAPKPAEYTPVYTADTKVNGVTMTRCWNHDLQVYEDGRIAALIKARADDNERDHRFFYCRYNGTEWSWTYLGKAGAKLYGSEQDYTGLGALHPHDPSIIYISTPFDPRDDSDLGVHEIFKGVSEDGGQTWSWSAVTQNSTCDNLRPIVPAWNQHNTALLWWRGAYNAAQSFDAAVVGIIERDSLVRGVKHYVDGAGYNTTFADGDGLRTTGPTMDKGEADSRWHERTGFGNQGSVLTSSELDGEDAPALKTDIVVPDSGSYELWVNFWANPDADWRIKAGLSGDHMQIYRHMACQQVESGDYVQSLRFTDDGNTYLYQAWLGRVRLDKNDTISVFVDDYGVATGTTHQRQGNTARTWYDGVSYARVGDPVSMSVETPAGTPMHCSLLQNYPNPFNPETTIRYTLSEPAHVQLRVINLQGQIVATLVDDSRSTGAYQVNWNAQEHASGVYFVQLMAGDALQVRKMMLVR